MIYGIGVDDCQHHKHFRLEGSMAVEFERRQSAVGGQKQRV